MRRIYFRETCDTKNGKIPLPLTDVDKSCPSLNFLMWQICLLMLFAKIKFSKHFRIYSTCSTHCSQHIFFHKEIRILYMIVEHKEKHQYMFYYTVKPVLRVHSKIDKTKGLKD